MRHSNAAISAFFRGAVCVGAHSTHDKSESSMSVIYQTDQKGLVKMIEYSQGRVKLDGAD